MGPIFTGKYDIKVDSKGRITVPAILKKEVADQTSYIIEIDLHEKVLNIYPLASWVNKRDRILSKLNLDNREHSTLWGRYMEDLAKIDIAANGRLNIPKTHLEHIKILDNSTGVILGEGDRMRVMSAETYNVLHLDDLSYRDQFASLLS